MIPSFLSVVSLYSRYLARCFTSAGLIRQTVDIDDETTMAFWGPKPNPKRTEEKIPFILIHGFGPMAIFQWRNQVEFFAPEFDVYVPDLVFFGDSTTRSSERTELFQAVSIGKLVEKLGWKKFHMMGTSYGGIITYHVARLLPERVEKVIIASSAINRRRKDIEALLKRAKVERIEDLMLPSTAKELRRLMAFAAYNRTLGMIPDFVFNDFLKTFYSKNREEKLELIKGLTVGKDDTVNISPLHQFFPSATSLRRPWWQEVLIIMGEHDLLYPLEIATELTQIIGEKVKLEVIKKSAHIPQIESPKQFNSIVQSFLRGS